MNRAFEDLLANAIEEVRSGDKSIEEVLARPEGRDPQFASLLRLALSITAYENLEPSPAVKNALRTRIMSDIAREAFTDSNCRKYGVWNIFRRIPFARSIAAPVASVVLILALAGGSVYASQDALPGDALYGLKITVERAQLSLALSPEAKVDSLMRSAQKRTEEIARERRGQPDDIQELAKQYESSIQQALQIANGINDEANKERVVERLLDNLERHQAHLQDVYEKAPEQAKDAVLRVKEKSRHGLETAATMVSKEKTSRKSGSKNEAGPTTVPAQDTNVISPTPSPPTVTPRSPDQGTPATGSNKEKDEKESPGAPAKPKHWPGGRDR